MTMVLRSQDRDPALSFREGGIQDVACWTATYERRTSVSGGWTATPELTSAVEVWIYQSQNLSFHDQELVLISYLVFYRSRSECISITVQIPELPE